MCTSASRCEKSSAIRSCLTRTKLKGMRKVKENLANFVCSAESTVHRNTPTPANWLHDKFTLEKWNHWLGSRMVDNMLVYEGELLVCCRNNLNKAAQLSSQRSNKQKKALEGMKRAKFFIAETFPHSFHSLVVRLVLPRKWSENDLWKFNRLRCCVLCCTSQQHYYFESYGNWVLKSLG